MRPPVANLAALVGAASALAALAGCSAKSGQDADVVAGKKLFVQKCGSCHVLNRAGTKGTTGPNLDQAFQQAVKDGFGESAVRGVVLKQIHIPARGGVMPANLVGDNDAQDVASYVASVVAKPGKDAGLLATAVQAAGSTKPAVATNGNLSIPADPNGQLAFVNKAAQAKPGRLTLQMPNKSGVPHDITIAGKGAGKIVSNGVSQFSASFAAGSYTYFCSVPGHKEAGMVGKLTVK